MPAILTSKTSQKDDTTMTDKHSHICPDCGSSMDNPQVQELIEKTADAFFSQIDAVDGIDAGDALTAAAAIAAAIADSIYEQIKDDGEGDNLPPEHFRAAFIGMVSDDLRTMLTFSPDLHDEEENQRILPRLVAVTTH